MQTPSNILAATTVAPAREPFLPDAQGAPGGKTTQFIDLMKRALAAAPRHAAGQPAAPSLGEHSRPGCSSARPRAEHGATGTHQTADESYAPGVGREGAAHCARGGRAPQTDGRDPAKASEERVEFLRSHSKSRTENSTPETEATDDLDFKTRRDESAAATPVADLNPTVMPVVSAPVPVPVTALSSEADGNATSDCASAALEPDAEADSITPQASAESGIEENVVADGESSPDGRTEPAPASLAGEAGSNPAIATSQEASEATEAGMAVAFETSTPEAMEAAPDGPPVQVEPPASATTQPPLEGDGTGAAQEVAAMTKAEQQNEFAAPEKEVPGDEPLSPGSGLGASHTTRADNHEPFVTFNAPPVESIFSRSAAVNEVSLASLTADHRVSALERTHDLVAMHAIRLRDTNTESLQIVLKPGGGLELSLELRQHEGTIEARAAMQSGDFNHLNRHWTDLQQRLEARGIRLAPLTCADQFLNSNPNSFQQQPGRASKDDAPGAGVFPKFTPTTATVITTAPHIARATGRGWESWA